MDRETKMALGRIMGEVLRTQRHTVRHAEEISDGLIYGLLHGIEDAVDEVLLNRDSLSAEEYKAGYEILKDINDDKEKFASFTGFYDIEDEMEDAGLDRLKAMTLLTYLKARGEFHALIEKCDSNNSPAELRHLEVNIT